jgi:GH24 family phage-related lysozyme (muramidase)
MGANLIKHYEGCLHPHGDKYKAYKCPANVTTIGWGTTSEHGHPIKMDTVWTKQQCDEAFLRDMKVFEQSVRKLVKVELEPWQFDSLTSFVYNVGEGNLARSTLLKHVNAERWEAAAAEFHKWNKANGKVLAGLTRRRASESLLFQNVADENYDGKADPSGKPAFDVMPQTADTPEGD